MCIQYTLADMHLSDYMTARGLKDQRVADETGVHRATISRIRRRETRPTWDTIKTLKDWSGGQITADDFQELAGA